MRGLPGLLVARVQRPDEQADCGLEVKVRPELPVAHSPGERLQQPFLYGLVDPLPEAFEEFGKRVDPGGVFPGSGPQGEKAFLDRFEFARVECRVPERLLDGCLGLVERHEGSVEGAQARLDQIRPVDGAAGV